MNLASRSLYRTGLLVALAAVAFIGGCRHEVKTPPPPPPPPPPAARPTVTLQASPSSINKGQSSTLSWNSTDATQLSIAPDVGAVTAQGSTPVTPSDTTTYTITATGPGGSANATATVSVAAPPPPPPPPAPEPDFNQEVRDAYFDYDKADIRPDARVALSTTADFLKRAPSIKVIIEGHCDERGSTEYNLGLGDRRASAVKQYLVSLGVSADRLSTVSFGKEKPFCTEHNEACWQQNRRGHFVKAN
jgi:peptidoglycan-associated lipoprotein